MAWSQCGRSLGPSSPDKASGDRLAPSRSQARAPDSDLVLFHDPDPATTSWTVAPSIREAPWTTARGPRPRTPCATCWTPSSSAWNASTATDGQASVWVSPTPGRADRARHRGARLGRPGPRRGPPRVPAAPGRQRGRRRAAAQPHPKAVHRGQGARRAPRRPQVGQPDHQLRRRGWGRRVALTDGAEWRLYNAHAPVAPAPPTTPPGASRYR
jgi:hypothetical protein